MFARTVGLVVVAIAIGSASVYVDTSFAKPQGDKWVGKSNADGVGDLCNPFSFAVYVKEGQITGEATTMLRGHATVWQATGTVSAEGAVQMRTEATSNLRGTNWATWVGKIEGSQMMIEQPVSKSCRTPRKAVLKLK